MNAGFSEQTSAADKADSRVLGAVTLASFALVLGWYFMSALDRGLWEDGYFVIRFARNFWNHGVFAWNVQDGPLYGMTSQVLQGLGTLGYLLAPKHVVLFLKASMFAALFATLWMTHHASRRDDSSRLGLIPAFVGLSCTLVLESATTGLETPVALLAVTLAAHGALAFQAGKWSAASLVGVNLLLYVTRPDAILIQAVLLAVLGSREPRRYAPIAFGSALGLGALLLGFHAYYGTAVPLAFYLKTHGLNHQGAEHIAHFAVEKTKNVTQFVFLCAPFAFVASHRRRAEIWALLLSAAVFVLYHYVCTIEHMGHASRYYMPALAPVLLAAAFAYEDFLSNRRRAAVLGFCVAYISLFALLKRVDVTHRVPIMIPWRRDLPFLIATLLLVSLTPRWSKLGAMTLAAVLVVGTALSQRITYWRFDGDRRILLRQITPRKTFRGLEQLQRNMPDVHAIFHHDMGAPGLLFPETEVIDLDGLLNERVTLEGARFEELCRTYKPEAIFVPNPAYAALRREVLGSACLVDYRPADTRDGTPLHIRKDLWLRYTAKAPRPSR